MIVGYLDFGGTRVRPYEADTKLIVNANAVLPASVPGQPFKPIAWGYAKVTQNGSGIKLVKLSTRYSPYRLRASPPGHSGSAPVKDILGSTILKRYDHGSMIAWHPCYNKRSDSTNSLARVQDGPAVPWQDSK